MTTREEMQTQKMSDELRALVTELTPFQRKYSEFRAKGFKQADAAQKAGSEATDRGSLARSGWNCEQMAGVKAYMAWLYEQRARAMALDETEIIEKLREVYTEALGAGKYSDANKAAELLGTFLGMFRIASTSKSKDSPSSGKPNTDAFKQEDDSTEFETAEDRVNRIAKLISQVNRGTNTKVDTE